MSSTVIERGPDHRPALSRCISVDPETFAREHWGRAPLLSTAAELGSDFSDLFSRDAVDELVSRRGVRTPFMRMAREGRVLAPARFSGSGGFGAEVADQVDSTKALREFAAGSTIVLQGLHRLWPALVDFTTQLIQDIAHPAQVNAYVTPASSRGFDPHYDVHDVFVLQVAGEKRWRIHAPVHEHPLRDQPWTQHREAVAMRATEAPAIETVLRPGDALYLPRGWIHSAEALGETSVHLTIGMPAYTREDIARELIARLGDVPALREQLPLGLDWTDTAQIASVVDETAEVLRHALGSDGAHSAAVAEDMQKRFAADTRPQPVRPLATVDAIQTLDSASRVRWRTGLPPRLQENDEGITIVAEGHRVTLPVEAADAVRRLADGSATEVGALPGLDAESALVVARRLLREAVVVIA